MKWHSIQTYTSDSVIYFYLTMSKNKKIKTWMAKNAIDIITDITFEV